MTKAKHKTEGTPRDEDERDERDEPDTRDVSDAVSDAEDDADRKRDEAADKVADDSATAVVGTGTGTSPSPSPSPMPSPVPSPYPDVEPYTPSPAASYFKSPEDAFAKLRAHAMTTHGLAGDKEMILKVCDYFDTMMTLVQHPGETADAFDARVHEFERRERWEERERTERYAAAHDAGAIG